jgi:hypothetical protein
MVEMSSTIKYMDQLKNITYMDKIALGEGVPLNVTK